MPLSVLPIFSSKSFIVSGLMFRSLIHFEFIFVYGVRKCPDFILLHVIDQFSQNHLLIELFVFLVLSCMNCLYILEINPLSVVSLAIIFSHSEGCVFSLLVVSFAVRKLLSAIRPHLFTFVFISVTLGAGS